MTCSRTSGAASGTGFQELLHRRAVRDLGTGVPLPIDRREHRLRPVAPAPLRLATRPSMAPRLRRNGHLAGRRDAGDARRRAAVPGGHGFGGQPFLLLQDSGLRPRVGEGSKGPP